MYYPNDVIDEIREGNDIVDVIGSYVKLTKRGSNYIGLCPFHREKTPSFSVNRDNQFYHCFGCGASGNVISFIMNHENYSFVDSIKLLAERINYNLPENNYTPQDEYRRELKNKLYEMHKAAAKFYYESLNSENGKRAVEYLNNRRVSQTVRNKFGLGYSPIRKGALFNYLKEQGYKEEDILKSGLAYKRDNGDVADKFFNRLMFPIIDVYGNFIGFGGRVIGEGEPKYLNSPETVIFNKSKNLYNLNLARRSGVKELILVEGYMDVISIYEAGFHNVVASLGTAFNDNHANILKRYATGVILLFDSDDAGVKAVLRAIPVLTRAGINVKVLQVKDAKDPDEYIKKFGSFAFGELLKTAVNHIIFRVNLLKKQYSMSNPEEKILFINEVINIISEIDSDIERDVYIKEISDTTNVDIDTIKAELIKRKGNISFNYKPQNKKAKQNSMVENALNNILYLLATNKLLFFKSKDIIKTQEFNDEFSVEFYNILLELYNKEKPIVAADIASRFIESDRQGRVSSIFMLQLPYENDEEVTKAFADQVKIVKEAYINKRLEAETDGQKIAELIKEKKNIANLKLI